MKKIIAILVIMLGFSFSANAQQRATKATTTQQQGVDEAAIKKAALKDVTALSEFIQLSEDQQKNFKGLFEYKHRVLADKNLSQERKDILADAIEAKIRGNVPQDQVAKLDDNPKLMEILTH